MKAGAIELIWIVVSDLDEAVKYYTNVIGLQLLELSPEYGWAELRSSSGGARLGLAQENKEAGMHAGKNATITINVDDIEKARDELIKKGATIVGHIMEVPGHVKLQLVADSSGNHIQIVEKIHTK